MIKAENFPATIHNSINYSQISADSILFEWSFCSLNSPYTGHMEGSLVAKSVKFESSAPYHPTQDSLRYVVYNWSFMGQEEDNHDRARPPDGTCGSVIWDNDKGSFSDSTTNTLRREGGLAFLLRLARARWLRQHIV
ncbi:hypothetical protein GJ744_011821 [Endocarpon pusillum]|uniref:Uncharacterized protein n=1 Tax=Endocarpon pusillum TaxID=364733 RepID=A0A8H7AC08_9EURO|nr:hypothetical protein GJ744_011821 [Endocarpon pusillum]